MKTEIRIAPLVQDYLRALAPEPRRLCKAALAKLPDGGDTKPLDEEFEGFYRLRVGQHRFIYRYRGGRVEVFFCATRSIVYEYLAAHLRDYLG